MNDVAKAKRGRARATIAGVSLTHPDRVLWQGQGITKQELAEFYLAIGDWLLPHLIDRPLTLLRCPSGSEQHCFVQRHPWTGSSTFIRRERVQAKKGEQVVLSVSDIEGVIALVQAGVLEMHVWGATMADIEHPDRLVFDFDPGDGVRWSSVIEAAVAMRERLRNARLESFAKTTGGKGLHVVVPLKPKASWSEVEAFARSVARAMADDEPERYTATSAKRERDGRIYIDYLRNAREATAIAPYSTRAREGAPVATPVDWDELSPDLKPNGFTVANLRERLAKLRKDPWYHMDRVDQVLPEPAKSSA